jgi:hypothetical protein
MTTALAPPTTAAARALVTVTASSRTLAESRVESATWAVIVASGITTVTASEIAKRFMTLVRYGNLATISLSLSRPLNTSAMDDGALDLTALFLGSLVALAITVAFLFAARGTRRREWITAGVLGAVLLTLGLVDVLRASPRETHLATVFTGAVIPVLGALGFVRATAPMRARFRWPLVFVVTLVLLFGALLVGATMVPRFLP